MLNSIHIKVFISYFIYLFIFIEMLEYAKTRLFEEGLPLTSTMSLIKEDFKLAGEIMAMSILQDGQAPNFLSPTVYQYLTGDLNISDIKSSKHRKLCENVSLCRTMLGFSCSTVVLHVFFIRNQDQAIVLKVS